MTLQFSNYLRKTTFLTAEANVSEIMQPITFIFISQTLDEEFTTQLEEQERLAANARIPISNTSTLQPACSTLHSSRTSLASSHYD